MEMRAEIEVVSEGLHGGDGGELIVGQLEAQTHSIARLSMAVLKRGSRSLLRLRKIPRTGFGMVETNCRYGTSKLRTRAIQSPVERTFL